MMKIHTKKMLPADAGSFKQKEAELSGEYDWKVLTVDGQKHVEEHPTPIH